jgi:hypothetical protein
MGRRKLPAAEGQYFGGVYEITRDIASCLFSPRLKSPSLVTSIFLVPDVIGPSGLNISPLLSGAKRQIFHRV